MSNKITEQDREKLKHELAESLAYCSLEELRYWFRLLQTAKKAVQENKTTEQA